MERCRELRLRLPTEKWEILERWRKRGIARTYAELVVLALDQFHDKLLERDLREARLRRLEGETEE
jgi:hypothetical protein